MVHLITRRTALLGLLAGGTGVGLGACASPGPPPPVETPTKITVRADANINPNQSGVPSPVVIKLYDLKAQNNFMAATFFELFDNDIARLGPEMLSKEVLEIVPGATQDVDHTITGDVRYLGVIAGFRDISSAQWRSIVELTPAKTNYLLVTVTSLAVTVELNATRGKGWFGW
ncbi:type VI secretion system lipoprotein TssJ [Aquabacter cavernae]|uniref:type VI secretion system lipoprotein TssJ n=1 Tax=Aquabacter cavernae TaxID=2496029 RepID=UPI000F8E4793|nr:type VI secretion system lipoprotein TssJ [Aquabacter cavernae]